jgi:hypothetical protein
MNQSAIIHRLKRQWMACIVTVAGALLGAPVVPAQSADFYNYGPYSAPPPRQYEFYQQEPVPEYYYQGAAYHPGCHSCGCVRCGCSWRCGAIVQPRGRVIERRFVEREYYERRYLEGPRHYQARFYADVPRPPLAVPFVHEEPRPAFPYGYGGVRRLSHYGPYEYPE